MQMATWQAMVVVALVSLWNGGAAQARESPEVPLVLGTPRPDGNFGGVYLRRVYQAVFQRLNQAVEVRTIPTARLTLELNNGQVDGDLGRPWGFADTQTQLLRVDEPVAEIVFALWTLDPQRRLSSLDQLTEQSDTVTYTRGVVECEDALRRVLPDTQVAAVSTTGSALAMLHAGRNTLYCGVDLAVLSDAGHPDLAGKPPPRQLLRVGKAQTLHLYLNRRHAALVPRIQATLKAMKTEGELERLRQLTLRDFNLGPQP